MGVDQSHKSSGCPLRATCDPATSPIASVSPLILCCALVCVRWNRS
jgi:hypothetical protein